MFNPQKLLWPESKFYFLSPFSWLSTTIVNKLTKHFISISESMGWTVQRPYPRILEGTFLQTRITHISASTSTLKSPLSPRPNLMPSLSRETANATKYLVLMNQCFNDFFIDSMIQNFSIMHLIGPLAGFVWAHDSVHLFWRQTLDVFNKRHLSHNQKFYFRRKRTESKINLDLSLNKGKTGTKKWCKSRLKSPSGLFRTSLSRYRLNSP